MSIRRAAIVHGVPCITLYDRHSERVSHGTKPGPKPHQMHPRIRSCVIVCEMGKIGYWKTL